MTPQERLVIIDTIIQELDRLRDDISAELLPEWKIVGTVAELDMLCQQSHQRIRLAGPLAIGRKITVTGSDIIIDGGELTGPGSGTADGKALTVFQLAPTVNGFTLQNCRINCEAKTTVVRVQGVNGVRGSGAKNVTLEDNTVARCGSFLVSEAGGGTGIVMDGNTYPATAYIGSRATWCEGRTISIVHERFEAQCPFEQAYRLNNCEGVFIDGCDLKDDPNKQTLAIQWAENVRVSNTRIVGGRLEFGPLSSVDAVVNGQWKEPGAICKNVVVENAAFPWCDVVSGSENITFTNCVGPEPSLKVGAGNALVAATAKRGHKNVVFNGKVLAV